jgi:peptidoglycan/xylan/chitin deacetylase (PgdA/CDA1 family)
MYSRRDFLRLSAAAVLAAALPPSGPAAQETAAPVIYSGSRFYHRIALTFDDCWHPDVLQQLIDLAAPDKFQFTFFAIGDALQINEALVPGIWKKLVQSGHEIGYHTLHHYDPSGMSAGSMLNDFDEWLRLLQQVLGFRPAVHFARPPYDDLSVSFRSLCSERGLVATMYSLGYEAASVADGMNNVAHTRNGDIVQMHTYEDPPHGRLDLSITTKALPYLAQQGFGLVTMSALYDDLLREQNGSDGCDAGSGQSLTRTCPD